MKVASISPGPMLLFEAVKAVKAVLPSAESQGIARQARVGTGTRIHFPLLLSANLPFCLSSLLSFASHHPFLPLLSLLSLVTHLLQPPEHCWPLCATFLGRESLEMVGGAGGREDYSSPTETRAPVPWEEGLAFGAKCCGEGVGGRWQRCPVWGRGWHAPLDEHPYRSHHERPLAPRALAIHWHTQLAAPLFSVSQQHLVSLLSGSPRSRTVPGKLTKFSHPNRG